MCIRWAVFKKTLLLVRNLTTNRYRSTDAVFQQISKYFFLCQSTSAVQLVPSSWRSLIEHSFSLIYMLWPRFLQPYKFFCSQNYMPSFHCFIKIGLHHEFFPWKLSKIFRTLIFVLHLSTAASEFKNTQNFATKLNNCLDSNNLLYHVSNLIKNFIVAFKLLLFKKFSLSQQDRTY